MKIIYLALACLASVFVSAQCGFTISVSQTNVSCLGGSDGSASVSLTGGTGPFDYTWKNSSGTIGGNSSSITGLTADNYTVVVTDQSGPCIDSAAFSIAEPPVLTVSVSNVINATCGMANGSACATASGGTPAYIYTWSPGPNNNPCANNMAAGTYTLTAMDMSGCVVNAAVTITSIPSPTLSLSTSPAQCGMCNGSATATVTGGSAPYTYSWSNGFTAQTQGNLCQGVYACSVTDANGCTVSDTFAIANSNSITSAAVSVIPAACGQSNGAFTVNSVSGGTAPFLYALNGGSSTSDSSFANLTAGTYTLTITDSTGCVYIQMVSVINSNFTVQLSPLMPTCNLCDGSITSSIVGGTPPYAYQWSNGSVTSSINNLCAGSHSVSVTDAVGCFTANTITLASPNAPVINVDTIVNITCNGITSGSISITASGGAGGYTYLWNTAPPQTSATVTGLQSGIYMVTVTDASSCSASQNIYVANSNNIYIYSTQVNPSNCSNNGSATVQAYGGASPYTFSWSNSASGNSVSNLAPGTYTVTATDANGCSGTGTIYIYSHCYNYIKGRVYDDANQNCMQDVGELGLPNRSLYVTNGFYAYTNSNGDYTAYTSSMSPTVSLGSYGYSYYSPTCPPSGSSTLNFSQMGDTLTNVDFGSFSNPNYFDLKLHPGWGESNPGFQKSYWILFSNNSPTSQNVVIRLDYDPVLVFDSCNSAGVHFPAQHRIEWTFNNVPANTGWNWFTNPRAWFTVPVSVSITDSLQSHFEILPVTGDAYPLDNTLDSHEPVTGSRDPNEKSVFPEGNILEEDSVLFYTIHFQNNGNDTAWTVVVQDTISPYLDPATIVPGGSSHPYTFSLSGQGLMTFRFDQIMLPDSLTNEPESNGYFNYTIKQKPNNPPGTVIENTAYIYFDFNEAIVTNTTVNTIVLPLSAKKAGSSAGILIYPNPAKEALMIQYELKNNKTVRVELFNSLGELVRSSELTGRQEGKNLERIDLGRLTNGIYLVKVIAGTEQTVRKIIIQK